MKKKRSRRLKLLLIGICPCLLALILLVAGLGVYELTREIPEPVYEFSLLDEFAINTSEWAISGFGADHRREENESPDEAESQMNEDIPLQFRPLIPMEKAVKIPDDQRRVDLAESLNVQVVDLLRDIEVYEQTKNTYVENMDSS